MDFYTNTDKFFTLVVYNENLQLYQSIALPIGCVVKRDTSTRIYELVHICNIEDIKQDDDITNVTRSQKWRATRAIRSKLEIMQQELNDNQNTYTLRKFNANNWRRSPKMSHP